MLPVVFLTIID